MENISESVIAAYINVLKTFMQNGLFFECTWFLFVTVFSVVDGHNSRLSVAPVNTVRMMLSCEYDHTHSG